MLTRDSQRENAELVILSLLDTHGRMYGYGISKEIAARSDRQIRMTPGVLYPLLRELEAEGLISGTVEEVRSDRREDDQAADAAGRKRKWYKLTTKGRRRLAARLDAHRTWRRVIDLFIGNRAPSDQEQEAQR
ncbi:MAG: helix-turn-helix transcriptional regulator [Phycisphaerales bacterium]|nr:helix-turn-helix transcriptional regulator [Phycisphaerales bacterium]